MATTAFPRIPFFGSFDTPEEPEKKESNGDPNRSLTSPQAIPWDSLTETVARKTDQAGKVLGEKAAAVVAGLSTEDGRQFLRAAFFLASLSDKEE